MRDKETEQRHMQQTIKNWGQYTLYKVVWKRLMPEICWLDGGRRQENKLKATQAMKTPCKPYTL